MQLLDISFENPCENLALDEVLLDRAESGESGEVLRFWESTSLFVVLGVAQVLRQEVDEAACKRDGVPILRRCSAGGCVVQGPGCLNFTLVLTETDHPDEVRSLRRSYRFVLGQIAEAFNKRGVPVQPQGTSDLALGDRKVSGNAQRRRRRSILHHGTLLYGLGHAAIEKYIKEPVKRPPYRGERTHDCFLGKLPLTPAELRAVVCDAFAAIGPAEPPGPCELDAAKHLAKTKYAAQEWIRRR